MDEEASQEEPIRLLEVNAATVPTGSVEPFTFSPTKEIPFRTMIAEITPGELAAFQSNPEALPEGWSLSRAERFVRSESARNAEYVPAAEYENISELIEDEREQQAIRAVALKNAVGRMNEEP